MNGLRVYIKRDVYCLKEAEAEMFYSKRSGGPYYRWSFEEKLGRWQGSRMDAGDPTLGELELASQKGLPLALKARFAEHYLE